MKNLLVLFSILFVIGCKKVKQMDYPIVNISQESNNHFVIAFGSCNNQAMPNPFWKQIKAQKPDVWIWGGDVIYSDTEDMHVLQKNYQFQLQNSDYKDFIKNTNLLGTWDDHDYGENDGGIAYPKKIASQQLFLDFIGVSKSDSIRRNREGVYHSATFYNGKIKIIVLDTRYHRTGLTPDPTGKKRYIPQNSGSLLGATQWQWLAQELTQSKADFNVIMSSIQVLSAEHGFESWGNMPHEVQKLEQIILKSNAKGVILLSGDRHISEISMKKIGNDSLPLVDFTSSGITHSYNDFKGENNPYRVSKVVSEKSYGILRFDLINNSVYMEMWGEHNRLLEQLRFDF